MKSPEERWDAVAAVLGSRETHRQAFLRELRAYGEERAAEERERCAQLCLDRSLAVTAASIRALGSPPPVPSSEIEKRVAELECKANSLDCERRRHYAQIQAINESLSALESWRDRVVKP